MADLLNWLISNWIELLIPISVFAFVLFVFLWFRRFILRRLDIWLKKSKIEVELVEILRWPTTIWCLIIASHLGLLVSIIPDTLKSYLGKALWTLLLISLAVALINATHVLMISYRSRMQLSRRTFNLTRNVVYFIILAIIILLAMEIWGIPTTPIIILIAIVVLGGAIAVRDAAPNIFAGIQINTTHEIRIGDFIKLETGEEGYVEAIRWRNTQIRASDDSIVIIPNRRLIQNTVINYGRPLKKAKEPFHFYSRLHLTELTGLRAKNLRELCNILKEVPESVVYFHTHNYLEQHFYLVPEPANDFATWISESLGDEALGERLASIDATSFSSLNELRVRLVEIIEEYLGHNGHDREVIKGDEFPFLKSVSLIFPVPYIAHDLRELVEALRKISLGSLYFHVFEAKLRLAKGRNDFSAWMEDNLEEPDLAAQISRINPYTYTLEGLRLELIRLIEKKIG